ncbi:alpha/beta hydrolase [Methylocapsa palsarum]|uniref:Esterase/lipase superfamily enzyme n=1 Tax=Methylocapsa palsarum TaxID=1612308 RepID=A0A1I3ZKC1_9HYPH|nr:alpha/beta fold hydrolase [Methylocapsa palsarum]SFK44485.1 Esterase/lipase superfamily enzyme [Methylocapsa palsarum]
MTQPLATFFSLGGKRRPRGDLTSRLCVFAACCALLTLTGCASTGFADIGETSPQSASEPIFVVSTRKNDREAINEAVADGDAKASLQRIGVPSGHQAGQIERPGFGAVDPQKHFAVLSRRTLDQGALVSELATHLSGRTGSNRDILLYVHGFNTSYDEARFRLAQIAYDGRFGGVPVLFTWPAAGSLLDYGAAKESATISRDALAKLVRQLSQVPGVGRVHILAHSMGAWMTMEALRENAIGGSPDLDGKLGDVMLAAPDIDLNVFRRQLARIDASHVFVLVTANDRALSLSRSLAGDRPRLGALDPANPVDRAALDELGVKVYDLSREPSDWIGHGVYANAPAVLKTIGAQIAEPRPQDAEVQAVLGEKPVDTSIVATPLPPVGEPANPPAAQIH